jgi:hypothetical protein
VADAKRPAPVVTIVDPTRPGDLVDVLGTPDERPGISAVQAILAAILLVLGVGIPAAVVQTQDRHREQQRAKVALQRSTFALELFGVASNHRVALVFALGGSGRVVGTDVQGGAWRAVGSSLTIDRLSARGAAVSLSTPVNCTGEIVPPTAARAVLELKGQRRTVDLLAGTEVAAIVRNTAQEACGQVAASKALLVQASASRTVGETVELDVRLTNRSVHDVRIAAFTVDGVGVTVDRQLPLLLPKRMEGARFVLDTGPAQMQTVHLVLQIRECLAIGQVLSGNVGQGLVVQVSVSGVGGQAFTSASSSGLQQQITALIRQHCRH